MSLHGLRLVLRFENPFSAVCDFAKTTISSAWATSSRRKPYSFHVLHFFQHCEHCVHQHCEHHGLSNAPCGSTLVVLKYLDVKFPSLISRQRSSNIFEIPARRWFPNPRSFIALNRLLSTSSSACFKYRCAAKSGMSTLSLSRQSFHKFCSESVFAVSSFVGFDRFQNNLC